MSLMAADTIKGLIQNSPGIVAVGVLGNKYSDAVNSACSGVEVTELNFLLDWIRADLGVRKPFEATMDEYSKNVLVNIERTAKAIPEIGAIISTSIFIPFLNIFYSSNKVL